MVAARDWRATLLGPRESWDPSLRLVVDLLLRSRAQGVVLWGADLVTLYNDAYAPTIGDKHPRALGRPAREVWAELWDDLAPLLHGVMETGETFEARDRPFYIERHGYGETVWFDVSYSAVLDSAGAIGGVLCIVSETTDRVLAQRSLAESERRFRALLGATADIVFRMDADWTRLIAMDGKDRFDNIADPTADWLAAVPEPDRTIVRAAVAQAVAGGTMYRCEHRARFRSGVTGWLATRAVPIRDEQGTIVEWFGAASDITCEREQSETLKVIAHELDHRMKNALAMIQAIAHQTFRPGRDHAAALATFDLRLVAIADANGLLTGERGSGASLAATVRQAVHPHCPEEVRLDVGGPDLMLSPRTGLAFALALHELATNALKYGAWSGREGAVSVHWTAQVEGAGHRLALEWRERGGPAVTPPARRGFGSKLIERGLAAELDGTVALDFAPAGVRCRIDAHLPDVAEAA